LAEPLEVIVFAHARHGQQQLFKASASLVGSQRLVQDFSVFRLHGLAPAGGTRPQRGNYLRLEIPNDHLSHCILHCDINDSTTLSQRPSGVRALRQK
jgi:hypothetical protein